MDKDEIESVLKYSNFDPGVGGFMLSGSLVWNHKIFSAYIYVREDTNAWLFFLLDQNFEKNDSVVPWTMNHGSYVRF